MLISAHLPQNLFRLLPPIPMDQEVPSTASAGRWSAWLTWIPTSIFPLGFHLQYLSIQSHRRTQSVPVHGLPRPFASFGAPGDWPRDSATPQRWHGCVQPTILRGNRGAVPQTLATYISKKEMTTTQLLYIYIHNYIIIYIYIYVFMYILY